MLADTPVFSRGSHTRSRWPLRLIGLVILVFVLRRLDLGQLAKTMYSVQPKLLLLAVLLTVPFFILKSWRWRMILRGLDIEISAGLALQLYGAGLFAGQITPGQLGEMVRAHFLWRRGHDALLAVASVMVDRVVDLVLLVLVAMPGLFLIWAPEQELIVLVVMFGMAGVLFVLRPARFWKVFVTRLRRWPQLVPVTVRVDEILNTLASALRTPGAVWLIGGATVLALVLNFVRFYVLLLALGLSLPIGTFVFGVALANLAGLLPITVAGIGVRDAVLMFVFQHAGQPAEGGVVFSMLILLVAYFLNVAWGSLAWILETRRFGDET